MDESDNSCKKFDIFIIEDDEGLGRLMQKELSRHAYKVTLAGTGKQALTLINGTKKEILLVNYKLPDMSGKELIQKLIEKHAATPHFITLTGYGDEKVAAEMMKLGSDEYIVKEPKFLAALPEVVKHFCEHVENEQQVAENEINLKKNLELLKETGEMAKVGGWELDLETNRVYWTDATRKIHEVPQDYILTIEEAVSFFPGESKIQIEKAIEEAVEEKTGYDIELQFVTAKGNKLWVHSIGKSVIKDGTCVGLRGTFQDITQRKKAEKKVKTAYQQIAANEQQLRAANQELYANNQQLTASEQQLQAANQQLTANEQQLRATNQQLAASEQQLRAANQQLVANEQELINSKETAERYLNVAAEIIISLDKKGNITLLNESGHQLLGYRNGELIGENWFNTCLPQNNIKELKKAFAQLMAGELGDVENYESEVVTQSGEVRTILWHNSILKNEKGDIIGILTSGEDITERKNAEKSLQANKDYLNSIFRAAPVGIGVVSKRVLTNINSTITKMTGYNQEELIGKKSHILYPDKKEYDFVGNEKYRQIENKGVGTVETHWKCKNGKIIDVLLSSTPINLNDLSEGVTFSALDITKRKKAEKEILKAKEQIEISEERFRKAQEVGHIGSWEYNLQTEEFWGSDESKRIYNLNLDRKDFPVDEVMKIVAEKDREKVNQAMIDLVSKSKPYDIVFEITPKNTSERKIIRSIAELEKDEYGKPVKVTGVLHDITLQKTIEKQLIQAKEKAEEADNLKSAFLANMSHEIRTPMNGILGFTDLLKQPELTNKQQSRFIDIIQKSGNRMLETVNALIDISKIETGQVDVYPEQVNINTEVQSLFDFFKAEATEKGLTLTFEKKLQDDQSNHKTDRNKFNSIVSNLIKNAIKYTDEGFIKIGLEMKLGQLHCYVKDSGIGVPDNRQQAIFNRFEQADIKDTRAFQGSGLGLAITKAYVELLGGEIGLTSELGKGSYFWFNMPVYIAEDKMQPKEQKVVEAENQPGLKLKILLAEDDEVSAQYLSVLLKNKVSKLYFATSGEETIALCKKHPDIDLVLMDIKMPEGNGYDSLEEIRKFNDKIIIIAQTANALAGDREKILTAGFDEYVSKPIKKNDLMLKIEKLF